MIIKLRKNDQKNSTSIFSPVSCYQVKILFECNPFKDIYLLLLGKKLENPASDNMK